MKIVADANIPLLEQAFGPVADVHALPAGAITPETVADADALLVRSVTRVDAALLDESRVRFVATATIGLDHVDTAYLDHRNIGFASAQGSNARSVAEYVLAALCVLARRTGRDLFALTVGVVGVGNVGGRLAGMLEALGLQVLRNDPPLARQTGDPKYVPLDALAEADVVTFHVPLARTGRDATHHMVNRDLLGRLKAGVWLVNTSRGAVAETDALAGAAEAGRLGALVSDVWENEPDIPARLLERAALGTPHVAGYSYDGKVNGTRMVLEALCEHFGIERAWDPSPLMPPPANPRVDVPAGAGVQEALGRAVRAAYDIEADDARLRAMLERPGEERAAYFTALRRDYPVRREFPETTAVLAEADPAVAETLKAVGFGVES
ncbi:MAG: 4-phosphoerythronate dehydrogenase [Phycisphaerae bacterium]